MTVFYRGVAGREDPQADTAGLERRIDALVYRLCGLTDDEIKIVEGRRDGVLE